jgi:hypothetical protein
VTVPRPRLVVDGAEGLQGRALMLISALHVAPDKFKEIDLVLLGPDAVVAAAAEALQWDTGLSMQHESAPAAALRQATLFAAVAFTDTAHLPMAELARGSVPALIAVQFPDPARHRAATLTLQRAAHDPRLLAEVLAAQFERL